MNLKLKKMIGLIIAILMNLGLIYSVDDFNSKSSQEQIYLQEIVIGEIDGV